MKRPLKHFFIILLTTDMVLWQLKIISAVGIASPIVNTSIPVTSKQENTDHLSLAIPLSAPGKRPVQKTERKPRLINYYKSGFRFEPNRIKRNEAFIKSATKTGDQKITASDPATWQIEQGGNIQQQQQPWAVHYATSEEIDSKDSKKAPSSEETGDSATQKISNSKDNTYVVWAPNQEARPWNGAPPNVQEVWPNGANVARFIPHQGHSGNSGSWNVPPPVVNNQDETRWDDAPGDDGIVEEWPNDGEEKETDDADDDNIQNDSTAWNQNNDQNWNQGPNGEPVNAWNDAGNGGGWNSGKPAWSPRPSGNNIQWKMYNEDTKTMKDIDEASGWKVIEDGYDGWKVIGEDGNVEWTIRNINGEWRVSNADEWADDDNDDGDNDDGDDDDGDDDDGDDDDESTEDPYTTPTTEPTSEETEATEEMTESTTEGTTEDSTKMSTESTTDDSTATMDDTTTESTTTESTTTETTTTTTEMTTTTTENVNYDDDKREGKYVVWKFKDNGHGEAKFYGGGGEPDIWTIGDNAWWPSQAVAGWDDGSSGYYISDERAYEGNNNGNYPSKGNSDGQENGNGGWQNNGNGKGIKNGSYGNGNKNNAKRNGNKNGYGNGKKNGNGNGNGRKNGNGNGNGRKNGNGNGRKNGNGNGNGKKNGNGNGRKNGNGNGNGKKNGNGSKNGNGNGSKNGNGNGSKNGNGNGSKNGNGNGSKNGNGNGSKNGNGNGSKNGNGNGRKNGNGKNGNGYNGNGKNGNGNGRKNGNGKNGNGYNGNGKNGNGNGKYSNGKNGNGDSKNENGKNGNGNGKNGNGNGRKSGNGKNGYGYGNGSNGGNRSNDKRQNGYGRPKGNGWQGKSSNGGQSGNRGNKQYSNNSQRKNYGLNGGGNNGWQPSSQRWSKPDTSYQNGRKPKSNGYSQNPQGGAPHVIIIKTSDAQSKGGRNPWTANRRSSDGYTRVNNYRQPQTNGWQWNPHTGTIGGLQWMESWMTATGLTADKNTVYTKWRPTKLNSPTNNRNATHVEGTNSNDGKSWRPLSLPIDVAASATAVKSIKEKPANLKGKQVIIIDYVAKSPPKGKDEMNKDIGLVLSALKSPNPSEIKRHDQN